MRNERCPIPVQSNNPYPPNCNDCGLICSDCTNSPRTDHAAALRLLDAEIEAGSILDPRVFRRTLDCAIAAGVLPGVDLDTLASEAATDVCNVSDAIAAERERRETKT